MKTLVLIIECTEEFEDKLWEFTDGWDASGHTVDPEAEDPDEALAEGCAKLALFHIRARVPQKKYVVTWIHKAGETMEDRFHTVVSEPALREIVREKEKWHGLKIYDEKNNEVTQEWIR